MLRDKVLLIQVGLLPILLVGSQLALNPAFLKRALADPIHSGATALGVGVYALLTAAPNVLLHERDALWMLWTLPRRLPSIVLSKVAVWTALAAFWAVGLGVAAAVHRGGVSLADGRALLWTVVGLPVYAVIAAAIGVLGCDPHATDLHRRLRPDFMYLLMMLGGFLVGSLYLPTAHAQAVSLVLLAALAGALWQKAQARLEALLDPTASPPRRLDLADGLIALALFFFLQAVGAAVSLLLGAPPSTALFVAFVAGGALTVALTLVTLWRHGVPMGEALRFVPHGGFFRSVGVGLAAGLVAAAGGAGWMRLLDRLGISLPSPEVPLPVLAALTVGAAPLFEEILFRGMVFTGLRRSLGFAASAGASALLFAAVHPPIAFVPVLGLGLACAWASERGRGLLAPILAHGMYNAAVLALQLA